MNLENGGRNFPGKGRNFPGKGRNFPGKGGTGPPALAHVFMFLEVSKRQAMLLEPCSLGLLTVGGLRRKGGKAKPAGVLPEYSLYTTHCWRIW